MCIFNLRACEAAEAEVVAQTKGHGSCITVGKMRLAILKILIGLT